jgi:tungstate transport system permease protein
MSAIIESVRGMLLLVFPVDHELLSAVWTSLITTSWATLFASVIGIPSGIAIAIAGFPLKRVAITLLNTMMAMPTVVIGLIVYAFISRRGLLGTHELLFTPKAMIIGQTLLAVPIIANFTLSAVKGADYRILPTALTLGASAVQSVAQLIREVRFGVMAAVIAGFGRVISEVGIAMMLGGNIRGYTRTMTTAIALETSKGEFAFGLSLGAILMAVAFAINILFNVMQQSSQR